MKETFCLHEFAELNSCLLAPSRLQDSKDTLIDNGPFSALHQASENSSSKRRDASSLYAGHLAVCRLQTVYTCEGLCLL